MKHYCILGALILTATSCVTTDENGARVEKLHLTDVEQTLAGQKFTLSAPEAQSCSARPSKDMQFTLDALKDAEAYVNSVAPAVLSTQLPPRKRITVEFTDTDLREALLELSEQIGINIIAGDEVQGTVSLKANNMDSNKVLAMTIASGGFDYIYRDKYIYVGDAYRKNGASANAFLARFNYKTVSASPKTIIESLPSSLRQYVVSNDTMGVVSISAPRPEFKEALRQVVSLDRPSKQVRLKLSVAYITDNAMDTLGKKVGGSAFSAANAMDPIQPSFAQGVYDKTSFDQFLRSVQLLSQTGEAEIKAEPQIVVLDGEKAVFGSKQVSLVKRTDGALDKNNALEGGISMKIEPRIVDGDSVLLFIEDAKSGDIAGPLKDSTTEQMISTKVRVSDGNTLVLGGLRQAKTSVTINKVPLLGDIPYIGWLFKNKQETVQNTQVIFAVTPEIVCQ